MSKFNFLNDENLVGTFMVGASTIFGAFFSYLLQLLLARYLTTEDFGTFNALLSLSYIITVPAGIFGTPLVKVVSELLAERQFKKLTSLFWKMMFASALLGGAVFFLLIFCSNLISANLKIHDSFLISLFSLAMGLTFIAAIPVSFLQGLQRYKAYSFQTIYTSFFRLIVPIIFILLGYKLRGVFGGFSVAAVIALVWSYILLKKNISSSEKINVSDKYKKVLIVSLPVILMSLDLMLLGNIDSILVKKYFDPISAGYYAGVVTLGKIFLFGAGAVSTVMFPQIAALVAKKQSVKKAFTKFVLMQLALIVAGILAYNVFPDLITTVFFKDKFTHAIPYLPLFATFIGLYVFINFMALFFIAVEKFKIYLVMVPGVVLQFVLIALYHQTLTQIIMADIAGALLVLVCMIVYYFEGKIA